MYIIDVSNVTNLLLLLTATLLLIFLGKEVKKPYIPAIPLAVFLVLSVFHSIQFNLIPEINYDLYRTILIRCIGIDLVMIFLSFISYLWIDDIACKFYKKKSIDNSLEWFWNKV